MTRRPTALAAFAALTLLAPLGAGIVLAVRASTQSPLESAAHAKPLLALVESATRSRQAGVLISVVPGDALTSRANASGLVTAVPVGPGAAVSTGTVVAVVLDSDIVAYQAERPLYADTSPGAKGASVKAAQQVLSAFGYYHGDPDGSVGSGTVTAIRAFNAAHGYGKSNATFSLAALTWIGPAPVIIAKLSARPGDTVLPGSDLFTTTAAMSAIKVTESPGMVRDTPVKLIVNGFEIPYTVGSGLVSDSKFASDVAASLGTQTEGAGTVELLKPVTVGTLPASAVVTDAAGHMCFFGSQTSPPTPVTPLDDGSIGSVDVVASLVGTAILVNPRAVRANLSCG
jgi:peptidoglycan hydrolase-like protein with peptidoglycan-binding domain